MCWWWEVTLSYDKSDVTELAEPPDVLHGWEASAGVVAVVEHRRLRAVRQLYMLGLTQRAATYNIRKFRVADPHSCQPDPDPTF